MLLTIFYFLALFFLLRFILRFVLPLLRITSETSRRMREMQSRMNDIDTPHQDDAGSSRKKPAKDEYIEYEEVK